MADRYASLKQGLVGAWIPSISGSGLLLPDLSGRGNNGTLTNMGPDDWVSGQYGRALDFDGVDDLVNLADTNALRITSGSITGWFKSAPLGAGVYKCIFASYAQSATVVSGISLGINISATNINQLGVVIGRNTGGSSADVGHWYSSTTVTDSLLHSFAVVIASDGSVVIYVDGKQTTTTRTFGSTVSPAYAATNYVGIGAEQTGPTYGTGKYWPNILDDIRIYNRALTEPEIKLLASKRGIGLEPRKPKLLFYQFPSGARRRRILTGMP